MNLLIILIGMFFSINVLAGWGSPTLLPEKDRKTELSISHTLDQKKAYIKTLIFLSKKFGDANSAIKLKEPDLGLIVAKGNIDCKAMNMGNGFAKEESISFDVEFVLENKKAVIKFENILGKASVQGTPSYDNESRPSSKEEMASVVKDCLDPFLKTIQEEIK